MAERTRQRAIKRAILIAGPTASGKSTAALNLARALGGTIISADAMQVYRELKILTNRPGPEEERVAPHRLFGHVPAAQAYSAAQWLADARQALAEAWEGARVAIVVGGTGLYFRSLEKGLSNIPHVAPEIRVAWRRALSERGPQALHDELAACAPEEARRLRPTDGQRIARALEVLEATGEPLVAHHARQAATSALAGAEVIRVALMPDRSALYRRCDERFLQMIDRGALDEVKRLMALELDPALPAMRAIGVAPLMRHLGGEIGLGAAITQAQRDTRHYAKRQLTWLRHQMAGFDVVSDDVTAVGKCLDLHG